MKARFIFNDEISYKNLKITEKKKIDIDSLEVIKKSDFLKKDKINLELENLKIEFDKKIKREQRTNIYDFHNRNIFTTHYKKDEDDINDIEFEDIEEINHDEEFQTKMEEKRLRQNNLIGDFD